MTAEPPPQTVEREGKVFQFGDYPDKGFSLSAGQYLAANPGLGAGVPIDLQHFRAPHPLAGKLGHVVSTEVRGDSLFARVRWPKALDDLLGGDRKVSCHFTPDRRLKQIDLVVNPRIKDAFLFAGVEPEPEPEPAGPGREFRAPEVVFDGAEAAHKHTRLVAQDMHDIAASCYPGLCYGPAMFASDSAAKKHMALIHKKSLNHGATCSRMPAFSDTETEDPDMADQTDRDKDKDKGGDVTLSDDVAALKATVARQADQIAAQQAENARIRNAGILKDAHTFAEGLIRPGPDQRALPGERPLIVKGYVQAALDDAATPRDVTFSLGEGEQAITFGASRLADFLAKESARPALRLGVALTLNGPAKAPANLPAGHHTFAGDDAAGAGPLTDEDKKRLDAMAAAV